MASKNSPLFFDIGQGFSIMLGLPKIPSWKTASRPKKAKRGTLGYNSQTNDLEYWDGTAWFAAPMKTD